MFSVNAVLPVFLVMLLGYILRRREVLTQSFIDVAVTLVFYVSLPAKMFLDVAESDFFAILDGRYVLFLVCATAASFAAAWALGVALVRDKGKIGAFAHCAFRGNFVYIGLPLVQNLLQAEAVPSTVLVVTFVVPLYNVLSVLLLSWYDPSGTRPSPRALAWQVLKNPMILAVLAVLVLAVPVLLLLGLRTQTEPPDLTTEPAETGGQSQQAADLPETDFSLLWTGDGGRQEFLELGEQDGFFPFGTSLVLTEPEEVLDTDDSLSTLHRADCGDLHLEYLHTGYDPEQDPEAPEQEFITKITTMVPGYTTPRGIGVGDTKEDVLRSYGDELVYCLKEQGGYTLVKHDYYYAFQTPETFGQSLCLYMRDGLVAGIKLEHMLDAGNTAYAPNNVTRFPLADGEPDFSARQEPEREEISDTQQVYIAWNRLVTDSNLSAEERYACRRDVFSLLPNMDWGELRQMGSAENPDDAIFGLMTWLEDQASYSSAEILWLQMGCTAQGLDGAYTEGYCRILSRALFSDPVTFSKSLATDGVDEAAKSSSPPTTPTCTLRI